MSHTAVALASLFTNDALQSSFDAQAHANALQGRTYEPLLTMLDGAYGLQIPAGTAKALTYINLNLLTLPEMPKLARGVGALAATVTVTQALHAYATVLLSGMSEKARTALATGFEVAPLPAWADPVAIAKAKALKKAKRDAAKAAAEAVDAHTEAESDEATESAPAPAPRVTAADAMRAWSAFESFLSAGLLTAAQRDEMISKLERAVTVAEEAPAVDKKARATRRAKVAAQDAVAKAAILASFSAGKGKAKAEAEAEATAKDDAAGAALAAAVNAEPVAA